MILDEFVKEELYLANGCTEPGAVAYAVSSGMEYLKGEVKEVLIEMDGFVYKNGKTTGIPGVHGYRGNEIAAALGMFVENPQEKKLEILSDLDDKIIEKAAENMNKIKIETLDKDHLYIHVTLTGEKKVETLLEYDHTNLLWIKVDDEIVYKGGKSNNEDDKKDGLENKIKEMSIAEIVNLVDDEFTNDHLEFLKDGLKRNMLLVETNDNKGTNIGNVYDKLAGNDLDKIKAVIANGVEARMKGIPHPALASSGSGDQGITISLGIYELGKMLNKSEEEIFKATLIGHLITYYVKLFMGKLSSFCGLFVAAAPGILAGFLYMDDLNDKIEEAIISFYGDTCGVLCDGAKSTCALKAVSAFESAYKYYILVKNGLHLEFPAGCVANNLPKTLENISKLSGSNKGLNSSLIEIAREL